MRHMVAYQALTGYQRAGSTVGRGVRVVATGVGGARVLLAGKEKREEEEDGHHFLQGKPSVN
jgi:hypothetical protein